MIPAPSMQAYIRLLASLGLAVTRSGSQVVGQQPAVRPVLLAAARAHGQVPCHGTQC